MEKLLFVTLHNLPQCIITEDKKLDLIQYLLQMEYDPETEQTIEAFVKNIEFQEIQVNDFDSLS